MVQKQYTGISNLDSGHRQSGFTLVELLVGLVLTLFIAGVALTYMVSSARTFRTQSTDSISQENARFALELLAQNVRLAGLDTENEFKTRLAGIYNGSKCEANSEASIVDGKDKPCTVDELSSGSDRFGVDFVANANVDIVGCNGQSLRFTTRKILVNLFWTADLDGDGIRSLYCQTYNFTDDKIEGSAQPLIDGVDVMQVQYGVDVPGLDSFGVLDTDTVIDRYQSYTNLMADSKNQEVAVSEDGPISPTLISQRVRAIRIALLVGAGTRSNAEARTEEKKKRTYQLLDGPSVEFDDAIYRQIYTTTIVLPNSL